MKESETLTRAEVLQLVSILADQEKHFNGLETNYRLLASTWLLGSMGTMGYLLTSLDTLSLNFWLLIGLIGFAAGVGILLLWILDMKVYHKLLEAVFIQGVLLEIKYDWLPKIRSDMLMSIEGDVTKNTNLFYTLTAGCLFVISIVGFVNFSNTEWIAGVVGAIVASAAVLAIFMIWKSGSSRRTNKVVAYLANNYRDDVESLTD